MYELTHNVYEYKQGLVHEEDIPLNGWINVETSTMKLALIEKTPYTCYSPIINPQIVNVSFRAADTDLCGRQLIC